MEIALVTCPKCGSSLKARSQLLYYHDVTCPACSSNLQVAKSTRIVGVIPGPLFIGLILVLAYLSGPNLNPLVVFDLIGLYVVAIAIFYLTVFYSKLLKFKLKR
jgi:DNA-directed RNA polymerase subunit RPC12/RpoP